MDNREIARIFAEISDMLAIKGENRHRVLAYRRASEAIAHLERQVADVWREAALTDIPGIGAVLAEKIQELLSTGDLAFYQRLKAEVPPGVVQMLQVPDVGPKTAGRLWQELGLTSVEALEEAARSGRVQALPGMGARTEARILAGIEAMRRQSDRAPLGLAWFLAQELIATLRTVPGVRRIEPAGSLRRMRETVHDLDLLVAAENPAPVMACFRELPQVAEVLLSGDTKTAVRTQQGLQVDVRVLPPDRWGTGLQYFTGNQAHNIHLRGLAREQGLSLSEYALKRADGSEILCAGEEEVYRHLGLPFIPPELREDRGEIEAALAGKLPRLIRRSDLRGDLQMHTTWSDGRNPVAEMAKAARSRGLRYIAITDHSYGMGVAGGLNEEELQQQRAEIAAVNARYDDFRILAGSEVEIRADGALDFADEVLAGLDLVVASLHTGLRSGRERTTERVLAAVRNPHVDILAHPTGRLIGRREGADLDMEAVLQAAAETGTIIEINAHPDRLDLSDVYVRRAVELGVKLAINSDAHQAQAMDLLFFGVATARRGWATPAEVVNSWELDKLLAWLKRE
ncbi:MAG: DNA polymerase/3'-5' exonuclease PolX [Chloroflexota bacterium]